MTHQNECFLEKRYTKASVFEIIRSPFEVLPPGKPDYTLEMNVNFRELENNKTEVILMLSVTMKIQEIGLYKATIQQAGIFILQAVSPQKEYILNTFCPTLLYPYAVERLDNLIVNGAFLPLMLAPVNFEKLFLEKLQKQKEHQESGNDFIKNN